MFRTFLIITYIAINSATVSSGHILVSSSTENVQTTSSFSENDEKTSLNICGSKICMSESAKILNSLDESVDPCNDFYEFACGKFIRMTDLPDDKKSRTTFSELQDNVDAQLQAIFTENPQSNENRPFEIANIFMKSCVDAKMINQKGFCHTINVFFRYDFDVLVSIFRYFANGRDVREVWWLAGYQREQLEFLQF